MMMMMIIIIIIIEGEKREEKRKKKRGKKKRRKKSGRLALCLRLSRESVCNIKAVVKTMNLSAAKNTV